MELALSIPLIQRLIRWLGHVHCMESDHLPRQVLYRELREGAQCTGRPIPHFKDVCKHDLRLAETNPNTWEVLVPDHRAETKARGVATIKQAARKK